MTSPLNQASNRRQFLTQMVAAAAAAAVITPERALAGAGVGAGANWLPAVADVDADIPLQTQRLVSGRIPAALSGTLYRNGPAKFRRGQGASGHWFDGDGLIRRFHINDGKATLNARFADTPKRRQETALNAMVIPGFGSVMGAGAKLSSNDDANAANTGVMMAGGDLLALHEGGSPMRMHPETLETLGFKTFRDDLVHMPFSAHPRIEPDGSAWNFGGGGRRAAIWRTRADGTLGAMTMVDLPRKSYFHDFTMTARHIVIVLQPWLQEGMKFPISTAMKWRPELGTQVLVLDKADLTKRRIFELPSFAFFHLSDGWEEKDGTIRFEVCAEADPSFGQVAASGLLRGEHIPSPRPVLSQIVLKADGKGELHSTGHAAEFPTSDPRFAGKARRYTTHVTHYRNTPFPHALAMWDNRKEAERVYDFGDHQLVEEFLFTPNGVGENAGWLVGTTLNLKAGATELHILNAQRVDDGPIATLRADVALPLTFHGRFV
jgi:all-trans-8'-apo-beta-carotenal 15,15'-oxygenase